MIVLPNWGVTKKVMESFLPFALLALLYLYLLVGTLDAESAQVLSNPQLADIARLFGQENIAAAAWVHFIIMDLFVGRWIYWQGQETGVWTVHSLLFCLFAGPVGLLSHIVTVGISQRFFSGSDAVEGVEPVSN